jgi:hypothetical protein
MNDTSSDSFTLVKQADIFVFIFSARLMQINCPEMKGYQRENIREISR